MGSINSALNGAHEFDFSSPDGSIENLFPIVSLDFRPNNASGLRKPNLFQGSCKLTCLKSMGDDNRHSRCRCGRCRNASVSAACKKERSGVSIVEVCNVEIPRESFDFIVTPVDLIGNREAYTKRSVRPHHHVQNIGGALGIGGREDLFFLPIPYPLAPAGNDPHKCYQLLYGGVTISKGDAVPYACPCTGRERSHLAFPRCHGKYLENSMVSSCPPV